MNGSWSTIRTVVLAGVLGVLAACGGGSNSAPAPSTATLTSIEVTPSAPTLAAGTTAQLSATGIYSDSTHKDLTSQVTWSSTTTSVAPVTAGGVVSAVAVGSTTVSAALQGITGSTTLNVSAAALVTLEVTPATPGVAKGLTLQLAATGIFSDSTKQDLTAQVTWTSLAPASVSVSNSAGSQGLASALAVGAATVSATLSGISGSTTLTVKPAVLTAIEITPSAPSIPVGITRAFTATGILSDHTTQDLTSQVSWGSDNTAAATISNAAGIAGQAVMLATGTANISATLGALTTSTAVTVTPPALVSIQVTPPTPSIAKGLTKAFIATGVYTDNSTHDLTMTVTWSSSTSSVATVSNAAGTQGQAQALTVGVTTVSATSGAIVGSATMTVAPAALVSIAVTPPGPSVAKGLTTQLTATGVYTDSSTQDLTINATWASSASAVTTVSNAAGSTGLASAAGVGTSTVSATLSGVTGSTVYTVTPATLVSIGVTPMAMSVPKGMPQPFTATGTYTDNTTQPLTSLVWASSAPAVATISNAAGTQGIASTLAIGATTISATVGGLVGSTTLTVTAPVLTSIQVTHGTPPNTSGGSANIALGLTLPYQATGVYTDSTTSDVTTVATWTSTSPTTVASIGNVPPTTNPSTAGNKGIATSIGQGVTTITATYLGLTSAPVQLTVGNAAVVCTAVTTSSTPPSPTCPSVSPSASVAKGIPQAFYAWAIYTDGSTLPLLATWSASDPNVAFNNVSGTQVSANTINVNAGGSSTITATDPATAKTATASLAVTAAVLQSLAVTGAHPDPLAPANDSVANGIKDQFTATGTYSDNSQQPLTQTVTWSSAPVPPNQIAAISNSNANGAHKGEATAVQVGQATITATDPASGKTASRLLTVTAAVVQSLQVTSTAASLDAGQSLTLTATGTFSDGTQQKVTASWVALDSTLAVTNVVGFSAGAQPQTETATATKATAVTPGTSSQITLQATVAGVQPASTTVTVTNSLQSIAVTSTLPAGPAVGADVAGYAIYGYGLTTPFTAAVVYASGATSPAPTLTWTSTNQSQATITSGGVATTHLFGSTSITASSGAITSPGVTLNVHPSWSNGNGSIFSDLTNSCGSGAGSCHNGQRPGTTPQSSWQYYPGDATTTFDSFTTPTRTTFATPGDPTNSDLIYYSITCNLNISLISASHQMPQQTLGQPPVFTQAECADITQWINDGANNN